MDPDTPKLKPELYGRVKDPADFLLRLKDQPGQPQGASVPVLRGDVYSISEIRISRSKPHAVRLTVTELYV